MNIKRVLKVSVVTSWAILLSLLLCMTSFLALLGIMAGDSPALTESFRYRLLAAFVLSPWIASGLLGALVVWLCRSTHWRAGAVVSAIPWLIVAGITYWLRHRAARG